MSLIGSWVVFAPVDSADSWELAVSMTVDDLRLASDGAKAFWLSNLCAGNRFVQGCPKMDALAIKLCIYVLFA